MSNDDTNEPTGARLTDGQVKSLYFRLSHDENVEAGAAYSENRQLTLDDVRALLADRVALEAGYQTSVMAYRAETMAVEAQNRRLEAENARLQAANERIARDRDDMAEQAHGETLRADAAKAREAAMRPLVEQVAQGGCYYKDSTDELICIYCTGRCDADEADEPQHTDYCPITRSRALVATWATEQTPAAPEGGDHADE